MTFYRITPVIRGIRCLSINPFKEAVNLGIYPLYSSDRSLWSVDLIDGLNSTYSIKNVCHQDYGLKWNKNDITIRPLIPSNHSYWFNIRNVHYYPNGEFISIIRPFNNSKYIGYDLRLKDIENYWIFSSI